MPTLEEVLPSGTAGDLIRRCVSALKRAYALNIERYNEQVGDDRLTFGVAVWRNSWFLLQEALVDLAGAETARPDGSLVIRVGDVLLHTYKVGETETKDINAVRIEGTATKDRIVRGNTEQLRLFELTKLGGPSNLVLAHLGNPFDGLCAAYVGAPTNAMDGPAWEWVERIYLIPPEEVRRGAEPLPEGPIIPCSDMPLSDFNLSLTSESKIEPKPDES